MVAVILKDEVGVGVGDFFTTGARRRCARVTVTRNDREWTCTSNECQHKLGSEKGRLDDDGAWCESLTCGGRHRCQVGCVHRCADKRTYWTEGRFLRIEISSNRVP